jgi:hypothetical protein
MSGNRIANIVLGLVILCVGISAYAEWVTYRTRKDAELLVLDLHNMKVGESSAAEVQKLSDSHRRFFVKQTSTCNNDVCIIDFNYPKSLMAKLGLASDIRLGVRLQVYQGQLATVIMDLVCYTKGRDYGVYVVDVIRGDSLDQEGPFRISNVRGNTTRVRMTPDAPNLQRDRAYSLGLKCFDHIGRCRSKGELLPALAAEVVAH